MPLGTHHQTIVLSLSTVAVCTVLLVVFENFFAALIDTDPRWLETRGLGVVVRINIW